MYVVYSCKSICMLLSRPKIEIKPKCLFSKCGVCWFHLIHLAANPTFNKQLQTTRSLSNECARNQSTALRLDYETPFVCETPDHPSCQNSCFCSFRLCRTCRVLAAFLPASGDTWHRQTALSATSAEHERLVQSGWHRAQHTAVGKDSSCEPPSWTWTPATTFNQSTLHMGHMGHLRQYHGLDDKYQRHMGVFVCPTKLHKSNYEQLAAGWQQGAPLRRREVLHVCWSSIVQDRQALQEHRTCKALLCIHGFSWPSDNMMQE